MNAVYCFVLSFLLLFSVVVLPALAPLGSFIGNRLSHRAAVMLGGILSSMGLVMSSFANSLESLYLSLGILTGWFTQMGNNVT